MQQSWRQLAADVEQQQKMLQQQPDTTQHSDSSAQQSTAQAVLRLARAASLAGFMLLLWARCLPASSTGHVQQEQQQPSGLGAAVSSAAYLADVATGIAAIWRSEKALQQWRTAIHDAPAQHAPAGNNFTTSQRQTLTQQVMIYRRLATATPQDLATCKPLPLPQVLQDRVPPAGAASAAAPLPSQAIQPAFLAINTMASPQQSGRLLADLQAGEQAIRLMVSAVSNSLFAAQKFALELARHIARHPGGNLQLPGGSAVHDLQWVMLVFTALLVGELHQRQQGLTAVQLHTTQPTTSASSSSIQQGPAGSSSASSSSASSSSAVKSKASTTGKGSSKKGSSKKGSSKAGTGAQEASSSSSAASSRPLKKQQGSTVPPYHLQVLQAAGVSPHSLEHVKVFERPSIQMMESNIVPAAMLVLNYLLDKFSKHLMHTGQPQTSSTAAAAGTHSGTSTSSTTTSSNASQSSNRGVSSMPVVGSAAAVLALLAPSSLMWGELLVLFAGEPTAAVHLPRINWTVKQLWQTSLQIVQRQAAAKPYGQLLQAVRMSGAHHASDAPVEQQLEENRRHASDCVQLQMTACQDSWYRSCVELIVPSLLHMRAAGTMDSARYATAAKFWFGRLENMLHARIIAAIPGKGKPWEAL